MIRIASLLLSLAVVTAFSCEGNTGPGRNCAGFEPPSADVVCVTGTVRFFTFEGGFWVIRGDDDTTYDPLQGLPGEFRSDGLRVRLKARIRTDLVSFHMAGPIVEILELERL